MVPIRTVTFAERASLPVLKVTKVTVPKAVVSFARRDGATRCQRIAFSVM